MISRSVDDVHSSLLRASPEVVASPTSIREVQATLQWMARWSFPDEALAYTDEDCQALLQRIPLEERRARRQTLLTWQGYSWYAICPPLEGVVLVSLSVATDLFRAASLPHLFTSWKLLARQMSLIV